MIINDDYKYIIIVKYNLINALAIPSCSSVNSGRCADRRT